MASAKETVGNDVCVVGAGALGLMAIKNLTEQGLNVTAFEHNDYVGGLWQYNLDSDRTTVLPGTKLITSKDSVCMSRWKKRVQEARM